MPAKIIQVLILSFFLEGKNGEKTRTENKDKFNRLDFRSCCSCINQFTGCRLLKRILCRNKRRNCLKKAIFVCYTWRISLKWIFFDLQNKTPQFANHHYYQLWKYNESHTQTTHILKHGKNCHHHHHHQQQHRSRLTKKKTKGLPKIKHLLFANYNQRVKVYL